MQWPTLTQATTIGVLRLRSHEQDSLGLRLSLDHLLNDVSFRPAEMPPSALLIVRRFADPLPGTLSKHARVMWERAVRTALGDVFFRAAQPQQGVIPLDAEAVRFVDLAEALAALALDISTGRAGHCWWWALLLQSLSIPSTPDVVTVWQAQPVLVPPIIHYLTTWHVAETVLQRLRPARALAVLESVLQAYGITWAALLRPEAAFPTAARDDPVPGEAFSRAVVDDAAPESGEAISPSIDQLLQSTMQYVLAPEQQALLMLSRVLYTQPARLHSPALRRAFATWWRQSQRAVWTPHPASTPVDQARAASESVPPTVAPQPEAVQSRRQLARDPVRFAPGPDSPAGQDSTSPPAFATPDRDSALPEFAASPQAGVIVPLPTTPPAGVSAPLDAVREPHPIPPESRDISISTTDHVDLPPDQTAPGQGLLTPAIDQEKTLAPYGLSLAQGVASDWCGIFFLVNVMQWLNLPHCFEEDWQLASAFGCWNTLDTLARGLLCDVTDSDLPHDPVWRGLAALGQADVDDIPARTTFTSDAPLILPESWPVAPALPAPELIGDLVRDMSADVRRWLAGVLPVIRRILPPDEAPHAILHRRGRFYVTATHVDVVMHLDDVTLPVRRAGLDVNPGWLADFSRVVLFHYH